MRRLHPRRARRRRRRSTAAGPWLTQFTALVSRPELGGLLKDLRPMTASFAKVVNESIDFNRQTDSFSRCFSRRDPAGGRRRAPGRRRDLRRSELQGVLVPGRRLHRRGARTSTATASTRASRPVAATNVVKSGKLPNRPLLDAQLFGNAILPPLGTRPTHPDKKPPYKPTCACYKNQKPNLNGPAAAAGPPDARVGPMTRAIQKHLRDFIAIIVDGGAGVRASAATSCPTSASTCPAGCRSSAATSSSSRASSRPPSR